MLFFSALNTSVRYWNNFVMFWSFFPLHCFSESLHWETASRCQKRYLHMIKQTPPYMIKFLWQRRTHLNFQKRLQYSAAKCKICLKILLIKTGRREREKIVVCKRKTTYKTDFLDKTIQPQQSFQDQPFHMCRKVICHDWCCVPVAHHQFYLHHH